MPYVFLAIAIVAEVIGTSALKASEGFSRTGPSIVTVIAYGAAFYCLSITLRTVPVGVAYAIWSGVGVVAIAVIGWLVFRQSISLAQAGFIMLTLIGTTGLYLTTPYADAEKQVASAEG